MNPMNPTQPVAPQSTRLVRSFGTFTKHKARVSSGSTGSTRGSSTEGIDSAAHANEKRKNEALEMGTLCGMMTMTIRGFITVHQNFNTMRQKIERKRQQPQGSVWGLVGDC